MKLKINNLTEEEKTFFSIQKKYFKTCNDSIVLDYYSKMRKVENLNSCLSLLSIAFLYESKKEDLGRVNFDMMETYFWNLQKLSFEKLFLELHECKKYGIGFKTIENLAILERFNHKYHSIKNEQSKILIRCFIESCIKNQYGEGCFDCYNSDIFQQFEKISIYDDIETVLLKLA